MEIRITARRACRDEDSHENYRTIRSRGHFYRVKNGIYGGSNHTFHSKKSAAEFIELVKTHMTTIGAENTFNSDQSGFNLQLHTGRTLAIEGQNLIESTVQ